MWIFCLILMICCLGLLIKMGIQKKQINRIKNQIDFLCSRDTGTEITLERIDRSTEHLAESINCLLERYRDTGQQIKKNKTTKLQSFLRLPFAGTIHIRAPLLPPDPPGAPPSSQTHPRLS